MISLPGKLSLLAALLLLGVVAMAMMYPFLAPTNRVTTELLVVEGWIPTYALEQVADEFTRQNSRQVIVVRALYDSTNKFESGRFMAEYLVESLTRLGLPKERVHALFPDAARKDRTYCSAVAVKKWLQERGVSVKSLNLVTLGPHARRSRLLYQEVFGSGTCIGVIALADKAYDPARWWCSSAGVREVISECIAYCYAKFIFSPP
jgi:hypothetical protein